MGRITGYEKEHELPDKVRQLYTAVLSLIGEGADVNTVKVADITQRAGIGKGTAYDYFDSKEDIIVCAMLYAVSGMMQRIKEELTGYEGFRTRIEQLFDMIEKKFVEWDCFMRFVHMMTDSSFFATSLQQRAALDENKECDAMVLLTELLKDGQERGEVTRELPMDYMVFALMSKLVLFLTVCNGPQRKEGKAQQLRPYILEGVFAEFCR